MTKAVLFTGLALSGVQAAQAVDMQAGDWTVSVGGIANAYYTGVTCSGDAVAGLALAGKALGCGGQSSRTTIGNGLLPNALTTSAKSTQSGYDIKGLMSIMAHVATGSAIDANSGVDVRQAFFTFGNAQLGTFKLGRDYGIFGSNAILSDMTLLGAGAPVQATQRGRVTLGHIGAGYAYLGHYGQIAYSAPKFGSMQFDAALVSPVDNGTTFLSTSTPQVQAQLSFSDSKFKGWVGAKAQKFTSPTNDIHMSAAEIGGSYNSGAFGLLGNIQTGKAIGMLADADQGDVKTTHYLAQATFKTSDSNKLGLSYGRSRNRDTATGLRSNSNLTLGDYYSLTKSVTLVAEIGQTRSTGVIGTSARLNGVSLGGILFF